MVRGKIRVLYIAGSGRSGSTIIGNILGQIDGFFNVGELRYIWDRSMIENRLCGCGTAFLKCGVWKKILQNAYGGVQQVDVQDTIRLREKARTRHLPLMLLHGGEKQLMPRLGKYWTILENLYRSIQSVTDCRVIVDTSKMPSYAWVLNKIPLIDLYIVHLIRDPRGYAYSWLRKKRQPDRRKHAYMPTRNSLRSSILWNVWNLAIEVLWRNFPDRYMRIRYEDFVREPRKAVKKILKLIHENPVFLPFLDDNKVVLDVNHTTTGNPNRLQTGTVELRPDAEWKEHMRKKDKAIVTFLSWPLLLRYGYCGKIQ
jgi:hypothetical protein